jgi:hypothetical protein
MSAGRAVFQMISIYMVGPPGSEAPCSTHYDPGTEALRVTCVTANCALADGLGTTRKNSPACAGLRQSALVGHGGVTPPGKLYPGSPQRHPCRLGSVPSRHGGRRIESAYRSGPPVGRFRQSTCLGRRMRDWQTRQYSSASMMVITRLVTFGSEGSGECAVRVSS